MKNSSIIKGGTCLLLMTFAHIGVAQAGFARLGAMARFAKDINSRRMLGLTLAATGVAKAAETASNSGEKNQSPKQPKRIKSITIRHPLSFNDGSTEYFYGRANNFYSYIHLTTANHYPDCYRYYGHELRQDELKYGKLDWLFDKLMNTKLLSNLPGNYSFGVRARSKTAEAQFDSSAVNQNLIADSTTLINMSAYNKKPNMNFQLNDLNGRCIFSHDVAGIPSKDDTTVRLQAEVVQENYDGSSEKFVWDVECFTRKGCAQNYQKARVNKETTESTADYIEKCLRTPIKLSVPKDSKVVIGLK